MSWLTNKEVKISQEVKDRESKKNIRVQINRGMVIYTDDPKKIPEIKKKYEKYADKESINIEKEEDEETT